MAKDGEHETIIRYRPDQGTVKIDRTRSGLPHDIVHTRSFFVRDRGGPLPCQQKRSSAPAFSASPARCKARRRGWPRKGVEEAREQIAYGLSQCDILKIADNELEFMTGETDLDKGAAALRQQYPSIRLFNVTAVWSCGDSSSHILPLPLRFAFVYFSDLLI